MSNLTHEVMERWRKDFEEWYTGNKEPLTRDSNGMYLYSGARSAWLTFLGGRQSIKVEITVGRAFHDMDHEEWCQGFNDCLDEVIERIKSQGYEIKRF